MSFFWFISLQLFRISVCNSDRNRCRFCAFRIATWTVKCCDSLRRVSRSRLRPGAPEKWWFGVLENASKHKNTYCMHIAHICHMTILDFVFVTHFLFCIFCDAKLCHAQGWEVNAFCIFCFKCTISRVLSSLEFTILLTPKCLVWKKDIKIF